MKLIGPTWSKSFALAAVVAAAFSTTSSHAGAVFSEGLIDAGESRLTAAVISDGALDAIRGVINPTLDVKPGNDYADAFKILLEAGSSFSATTTASSIFYNAFDTVLYLFDAAGSLVASNDDDIGSQSTISLSVAASGIYYLAITGAGYTPGSTLDAPWKGETSEGGAYEIQLTGAKGLPEPTSLALVGLALGAAGLSRRRGRSPVAQA